MRIAHKFIFDRDSRFRPMRKEFDLDHPDPKDHLAKNWRNEQSFYELALLEFVRLYGPTGGTFFDVGANVGNHTIFLASMVADCVVSVEPCPEALFALRQNIAKNKLSNCLTVDCAVGDRTGQAALNVRAENSHNLGSTSVQARRDCEEKTVQTKTLDRIWSDISEATKGALKYIKLDIEGAELPALRGGADILQRYAPHVSAEAASSEELDALCKYLYDFGYVKVGCFGATPHYYFINPEKRPLSGDLSTPMCKIIRCASQRVWKLCEYFG